MGHTYHLLEILKISLKTKKYNQIYAYFKIANSWFSILKKKKKRKIFHQVMAGVHNLAFYFSLIHYEKK